MNLPVGSTGTTGSWEMGSRKHTSIGVIKTCKTLAGYRHAYVFRYAESLHLDLALVQLRFEDLLRRDDVAPGTPPEEDYLCSSQNTD